VSLTFESIYSNPLASVTETFVITFVDGCRLTTLTDPATEFETYERELYEQISIPFDESIRSETERVCGDLVYTLKNSDDDSEVISGFSIDSENLAVIAQLTDKNTQLGEYTFYIEAQLGTYNTARSTDFTVTVADPCLDIVFTPQNIGDMLTSVLRSNDATQDFSLH
jgi:hypothetical protein